ncbi:MAG TPA: TolC family protein [Acidobacteriaceae bacterium]|nr:TolC family protein [Acidobacteriaceae bacterium]
MDFPSNRQLRWNLKLAAAALALVLTPCALAQQTLNAPAPAAQPAPQQKTLAQQAADLQQVQPVTAQRQPFHVSLPHSRNPFAPYMPSTVPPINLVNSPRLYNLERDGKLYLSLRDAIALALENNLDLMYFRYNLPIAQADLMRTKAGGLANGVNTGIAQSTPGGFNSSASGGSSGGSSSGVTAAGAGGLVTSTLGAGSAIIPFDPHLYAQGLVDHTTLQQVNTINFGVPTLKNNTIEFYTGYSQAYPLGTNFSIIAYGQRQTTNSVYNILNPQLTTDFDFTINQPLLQGFGLATNERYIHIAKKNIQLTNLAFRAQTIATLTQVQNIYWALVGAYQDVHVKERSLDFAKETLADDEKQLQLKNIAAMQVLKDQAAVATSEGDLTVARANLKLNQLLIKNALTKTIDPTIADMPVIPLDLQGPPDPNASKPIDELITEAEKNRPDVAEDQIAMQNAQASLRSIRNELLPSLTLYGKYAGAGFGGQLNPYCQLGTFCTSTFPTGFGGAFQNTFNYSSPEYQVGFKLDITLRNRVAKADQFRAVLDYRQKEVSFEEQKKSIRFDVRNAQYALQQAEAQVQALTQARDLAQRTFNIAKQEQKLGAMSAYDTLSSEQFLAVAESNLFAAQTKLEQAKVNLDYSTGSTLQRMQVSIDDARSGVVTHMP